VLRTKENGDCGFLGERGCSVHPDRPLACGIYPLARWVSPDGEESFGHLTAYPKTEGVYGTSGTVQAYLDQQQLAPFFEMSERYGRLYQKMVETLEKLDPAELDRWPDRRAAIDELPPGSRASIWIDVDAPNSPTDESDLSPGIEDVVTWHIHVIEAWLEFSETDPSKRGTYW
jgi:uncharacterized protein